MEGQHRGRSLSAGHNQNRHLNHSHSPHHFQNHSPNLDIDLVISPSTFASGAFNSDVASSTTPQSDLNYNSYIDGAIQGSQYEQQILHSNGFNPQDLDQSFSQNISTDPQNRSSSLGLHQSAQQFPSDLLGSNAPNGFGDFSQDLAGKPNFENPFLVDPDLQGGVQPQHQSINPADIMSNMSSPQNMIPTPPNLIPPESHSSRQGSPAPPQGQFYSPSHSRNASLDPSSAIYTHVQQQTDWTGVLQQPQFQSHRRAPSEHSDVSSSVAPSPFLPHHEGFELDHNPSPMMHAQPDNALYHEALGIEHFSLSDSQQQQQQQQHQRVSPGHSPYVSPRMSPQTGLGIIQDNSFMLPSDIHNNFGGGPGPDIYADQSNTFPSFNTRHGSGDMGQVGQMAPPPEINVEFAPTTRQSTVEPPRPDHDCDGLTPPDRGRKGRIRAKSETYITRPVSAGSNGNLSPIDSSHRQRSLSPFETSLSPSHSRDPSPASKSSRRSSLSSISNNRDYILELADPTRPTASGVDKRVQKHPATFQCTLCPKRFTRAYNLRSHLRTHTDERPFVCTVCGKAFARQHDRKRHEGLHSGEKKFVCKGELGTGGNWGCGRRFARADALGRHFRSEAGRVCIKPLLDEEAMERQRVFEEQVLNQNMSHPAGSSPMMPQQPTTNGANGFAFPAALLLQYPDLQQLRWDQLAQPGPGDDAGELSGRGSFDASSQGEYFDDDEPGYLSGNGGPGFAGGGWSGDPSDWASDYEGR